MKKLTFMVCILFLSLSNCADDNDLLNPENNGGKYYYPLKVGNIWYYDVHNSDSNPCIKRIVENKLLLNGHTYYIINDIWGYSSQYPNNYKGTLRNDNDGNIWKYTKGKEYLFYDFSLKDGDTYKYTANSLSNDDDYIVTVKKVGRVETDKGVYDDCVEIFFDIPKYVDDEKWYIFAPNVGLIKETSGEGPTIILNSYAFYL